MITTKQNEIEQIQKLAAQRKLYSWSKNLVLIHFLILGPFAVLLALLNRFYIEAKPYVALWSAITFILDILVITNWQKQIRESAAKIQEDFDCSIYPLKWNQILVGDRVDPELIVKYSTKYFKDHKDVTNLYDWYPKAIVDLPAEIATIVCQRINCWWDGEQRRKYSNGILAIIIFELFAMSILAIFSKISFPDFIVSYFLPFSPLTYALIKQCIEQKDAAKRLNALKSHANKLWQTGTNSTNHNLIAHESRQLQDEIYNSRKRNPPVFDRIYFLFRNHQEYQMNQIAENMIKEYTAINDARNNLESQSDSK